MESDQILTVNVYETFHTGSFHAHAYIVQQHLYARRQTIKRRKRNQVLPFSVHEYVEFFLVDDFLVTNVHMRSNSKY